MSVAGFKLATFRFTFFRVIVNFLFRFQDVLPKKLKLMDDLKEKEEDEKESNERCENADMYQHIAEDVRQ